ncbi:glycosyltransferase [Patescibacteria group bacterium]|nr:glycosyltransferase [Patescibacteria group bacterium]
MIYDCFTFFNELDILKIRLQELNDCVDKFVLVEATLTFSGQTKPLIFDQNKHLFKKFLPKIIHIIVKDLNLAPPIQNTDFYKQHDFTQKNPKIWAREVFQRNCISRGLTQARKNDIILISDIDEIPNPHLVKKLPKNLSAIKAFEQKSYYYYLNCLSNEKILGTRATLKKTLDQNNPQNIRFNKNQEILPNAGWHFTYLGQPKKIIKKINSYSHQELNTPEVNDAKRIRLYIENNLDIFGRNFVIKTVPIDKSFPSYIQKNQKQLDHLIKKIKKRNLNSELLIEEIVKLKLEKENLEKNLTKKLNKKYKKLNKKYKKSQLLIKKRDTEINKIITSKWFRLRNFYHKSKKCALQPFHYLSKPIAIFLSFLYFLFIIFFFSLSLIIQKITRLKTKPLTIKPTQQKLNGVSFIIPTWNKEKMVMRCLTNLIAHLKQETRFIKTEIIIIDNGSIDQTSNEIKKIKSTKNITINLISLSQNLGFAKAVNLGAKKAKYNYLYLLNNDMFVQSKFFSHITTFAKKLIKNNQKFFALSSQIFFADQKQRRQESGKNYTKFVFGFLYVAHLVKKINLENISVTSYAGGGSSLVNKHLFLKLGGYDHQSYTPLYCEDLDLSFNAWRFGYPSIFIPQSQVIHNHQSSSKNLKRNPDFYMQKNCLAFILKNLNSPKFILHHIFLYPILMLLDKKYIEYAIPNLKNIFAIFRSRLRLNQFQIKYTDKQLINFLDFETKSNVNL